jgi:diaminohydroxyphosphoribosylaminopyrimidine deaminase/5-amino-6-(5-phosphoribosylamino)uracil reductase
MYVTLEPCCHFGKSAPCTSGIISSGIKSVVVACTDLNPVVSGKGIRELKKNGIHVRVGLMNEEAAGINEDFFWSIRHKSAWITLKLAMTLDGRIADYEGNSRWISNESSRTYVHALRRKHAGIAVGSATLLSDNPRLTVRHNQAGSPVRFVFSPRPGLGAGTYFRRTAKRQRSVIVCPGSVAGQKTTTRDGVEVWHTGKISAHRNLRMFARMAWGEGLTSILVEGGQKLASSFLEAGMVNRLYLFYGNRVLGSGKPGIAFIKKSRLKNAVILEKPSVLQFGDTFAVTGVLNRRV